MDEHGAFHVYAWPGKTPRAPDARLWSRGLPPGAAGPVTGEGLMVLDHAGPRAAHHAPTRPFGPTAYNTGINHRRTQALTADQWHELRAAAGSIASSASIACGINLAYRGLLSAALSPRHGTEQSRVEVLSLVARVCEVAPVPVFALFDAQQLSPFGRDPTLGLALIEALFDAGVGSVYAGVEPFSFASAGGLATLATVLRLRDRSQRPLGVLLPDADDTALAHAKAEQLRGLVVGQP